MTLPRKGSRSIVVGDWSLRWLLGRWRVASDWSFDPDVVDPSWLTQVSRCGLGQSADASTNLMVELAVEPACRLQIVYFAKMLDGFMGIEPMSIVKPSRVAELVERAVEQGWRPDNNQNMKLAYVDMLGAPAKPPLLNLPWLDTSGYNKPIVELVELWPKDDA